MTDTPTMPAMQRLRLRVLCGSFDMIRNQFRELSPETLDAAGIPQHAPEWMRGWRDGAAAVYAGTEDTEPKTRRPTTMEDGHPAPAE